MLFADGQERAPLRVHLLYHSASPSARALAMHLLRLLNGTCTDGGPRIPVTVHTAAARARQTLSSPDAHRSVVVALVDARMVRAATPADRQDAAAWARLVEDLLETHPPGTSSGVSVLPVAVDEHALRLSERLSQRNFVRLDAQERRHLDFHVVIACLRLLQDRPASDSAQADELPNSDVEVFVSHAKRDLPRQSWRGAVAALLNARNALPVKAWYDSSDIPVGSRFGQEIERAVRRATAVIVVLTDSYSSREWCRWELLAAKAAGRPIVVVDAIESQVVRLFPYVGNTPTVRWRAALADMVGDDEPGRVRETLEAEDAATVLLVTFVEALRYQHELVRLRGWQTPSGAGSEVLLGAHPELVTIAALPDGTTRMLYPDPPLGAEELDRVRHARPGLELATPLERLARSRTPTGVERVALSISAAPDAEEYGGTQLHLDTMAHDLALYLLLSGLRLAYGGLLGHAAPSQEGGPSSPVNYVEMLMELVESYSPLAKDVGRPLLPVENWLAWPTHEELTEDQIDLYHRFALVAVKPPEDLVGELAALEAGLDGPRPAQPPVWRYVRARCLTQMRVDSTAAATARIAMGGKLTGYSGLLPGVAEEALLSLRARKPLYLLGAFGGAARAVLDVLGGGSRAEFTSSWCGSRVTGWPELRDEYARRGQPPAAPEDLASELRSRGSAGLASVLANGLSDEDNRELTTTTDARRAVELVLRGLRAVAGGAS